ncbi:MAG: hypothetical protein DCC65_10950 [Planctomycetota bacterium]|nr:MAG: hypothetical protein DCC65_10950 [Planctomycetota bacterium]
MKCTHPVRVIALLGIAFSSAASAYAHDSWLIADRNTAADGEKVWLSFVTGEVFPYGDAATRPDRVDRFVDRVGGQEMAVVGFAPQDNGLSVRHRIEGPGPHVIGCALKPRLIEMTPEKFEAYLSSEEATAALARFLASRRAASPEPVIVEEYTKFAKTMIEVNPAGEGTGFLEPLGHRLEIVPLTNPCHWRVGDTVQIKVLLDGHPWPDVPLCVGREGADGQAPAASAPVIPPAPPAAPQPAADAPAAPPMPPEPKPVAAPRRSGPFSVAAQAQPAAAQPVKPVPPAPPPPAAAATPAPAGAQTKKEDDHHYDYRTRTNASGVASITLDKPGHAFIKAHFIRPTTGLTRAKWESFWASLTFRVAGRTSVNSDLQSIRGLRGDLTPGAVIGYRMGVAALGRLGLRRGDASLFVTHWCPLRPEYTSILDGLQAATGATVGRLSLRMETVDSASQMRTMFVDRTSRRVITMYIPDSILAGMQRVDPFEVEASALRLATLTQERLFLEEADETAVVRGDSPPASVDAPGVSPTQGAAEGESEIAPRAVELTSGGDAMVRGLSR